MCDVSRLIRNSFNRVRGQQGSSLAVAEAEFDSPRHLTLHSIFQATAQNGVSDERT